jgi:flagellar L-ring protein precursor FlgH
LLGAARHGGPSRLGRVALRAAPLLAVALLQACAQIEPLQAPPLPPESPLALVAPPPQKGRSGGVFTPATPWSILSDSRAFRPGDVLTVTLEETTQASKKADTTFGKESSVAVKPSMIAGKAIKTDIGLGATRDFNGTSSSSQQNALQGAITVVVHEVLPNGLLRIAGEKNLYLNQGEEFLRVAGYVRAADIDTDNRVSSQRIANARIAYSGQGSLADANNPGWVTRFFASAWMPF